MAAFARRPRVAAPAAPWAGWRARPGTASWPACSRATRTAPKRWSMPRCCWRAEKGPPGGGPGPWLQAGLLDVEVDVVKDEGRLPAAVFRAREIELHGLSLIGAQVEGVLGVARALVQVREGGQGRQDSAAAVPHLGLEDVVGGGGGGLGSIDVQPVGQRGLADGAGDGHGLVDIVRMRPAIAAQPRIIGPAVGRFRSAVGGDDAG